VFILHTPEALAHGWLDLASQRIKSGSNLRALVCPSRRQLTSRLTWTYDGRTCVRSSVGGVTDSTAQLVAMSRNAAMLAPGQSIPVSREDLHELCSELLESRRLLVRLGTDLRTVTARSRGDVG
jgi:hypothetical protein